MWFAYPAGIGSAAIGAPFSRIAAASDDSPPGAASNADVPYQSAAGLQQPLLQARQRPVVDLRWQHQSSPQVSQVVGDQAQL